MNEHEPTDAGETGSGLYRKLSPKLLSITLLILWALGGGLLAEVWTAQRGLIERVTTLEAQRQSDHDLIASLNASIKDIQSDIKELLREVRK